MTKYEQETSDSRLYILDENGNREPFGPVTDAMVEINTEAERIVQNFSDAANAISELSHAFHDITFECKASKQMPMRIVGVFEGVLNNCPNRRVSHLAVHARKKRTRTKNLNRAFRIEEKGEVS